MTEPMFCEPCQVKHGIDVPGTQEAHECWPLCEHCRQHEAEAAYERFCEDYYGGSGCVTQKEQYEKAHSDRRRIRGY